MNHVSTTFGIKAVDSRQFADDNFRQRMGNFDQICKQIDAKHDHVMEMLTNIQEQLRNLETKRRREIGVNFCVEDTQSQTQFLLPDPNPGSNGMNSDSVFHYQKIKNEDLPLCIETQNNQPMQLPFLTTGENPYSISPPPATPLITTPNSQIETLASSCTPKSQNIVMVVVQPKAIEPSLISSSYADIMEESNGVLVIKEDDDLFLDASGNREEIETNLVEIGEYAAEEMSEWAIVSDSARSAEQINPSLRILQQIKASSDTKKMKDSQVISPIEGKICNRNRVCAETIHRILLGQLIHNRIRVQWAEDPPGIPIFQPPSFRKMQGKPNTLAVEILVISLGLNVFDVMTGRELSFSKEVTVCMDVGEKIHGYLKTDLYGVPVATSVEDFEKKNNEAMQVFDPGGNVFDVQVLEVGDSLLELLYASCFKRKWASKKIYDWMWHSVSSCSYFPQNYLLKHPKMNGEVVLCNVLSKPITFGLVGCNICCFNTICLVLCFKNLLSVMPLARLRRICFYTFVELAVWKWLKDGNGTCLQTDSLVLARLCEVCGSLLEVFPTWNKHLRSDNLDRRIDDCLVARYFLESQFEMGNSRAIFHLYCLINLEFEKLMLLSPSCNMKTLLWLDWLVSVFRFQIYLEVCRIAHSPDLASLSTLDFESLNGGSSLFISYSDMFLGCSFLFGETIISTSIESKGQGVFLELIISFGSREFSFGVWMIAESLIKQRGHHSTISLEGEVDKMLDRPSAKPPFQSLIESWGQDSFKRGVLSWKWMGLHKEEVIDLKSCYLVKVAFLF